MKVYRSGIIGLGAIHSNHVNAINSCENAELCAVCDNDPNALAREKAKFAGQVQSGAASSTASSVGSSVGSSAVSAAKIAAETACPSYLDYHQMLAEQHPDVVHICTPHYLHARMAIDCMEAGSHVLIEKPLAMNPEEAEAVLKVSEKTGRRVGVCFQNRYNATSRRIRELLDTGRLGAIRGVRAFVTWNRDEAYYRQAEWRGKWSTEGGGVLINQAIHTLDLMLYFAGLPLTVKAQTACFRLNGAIEVEDTAHGYLQFPGGATGIFYLTNDYAANAPVEIEILLEHGTLDLKDGLLIRYEDGTTETVSDIDKATGEKAYWGTGHRLLIHDYYEALAQNRPFAVDGHEGMRTLRLLEAIYRSAATGNHAAVQQQI